MKMKIKKVAYLSLLAISLIMAIRSLSGTTGNHFRMVDETVENGYLALEDGEMPEELRGATDAQLRATGYTTTQGPSRVEGWTLAGSHYDVRGENYSSDACLNQAQAWNDLSGLR